MLVFEWDEQKNRRNKAKHGMSFERAQSVFSDRSALEILDECADYGEERWLTVGMAEGELLAVVNTQRGDRYRIISARKATIREAMTTYKTSAELELLSETPMTAEELKTARRAPRAKIIRRALGLTQEEFATTYRIPLDMLRAWEQGTIEPDAPARALLEVVAQEPEVAAKALRRQDAA